MAMNRERVEKLARELLVEIGEDPNREGLEGTPRRMAEAFAYLTSGYGSDLEGTVNGACFTQKTDSMVIVKDIELYSLCEHHLLPFYGRCHIGYIPRGEGVGVMIEARHLCMMMRGVEKQNSQLITSAVLGSFRESQATRQEFLSLINRPAA